MTRWTSVATAHTVPSGLSFTVLMMYSVEPLRSAACTTSNVHSGAAVSLKEHPIDLLRRLRFRVTLNTDNRLMSGVSMSSEFKAMDEAFGLGLGEMEWLTINTLKSAFAPFDERIRIINEVVKPAYAHLRMAESRVATTA